jgi:hypothetical protein
VKRSAKCKKGKGKNEVQKPEKEEESRAEWPMKV